MSMATAALTLFLIMDPLGNVPIFLSVLDEVPAERRRRVLMRELAVALAVMVGFLFAGPGLMTLLGLSPTALSIAGGVVLFLIALRMIFPTAGGVMGDMPGGEPLVVPLAIPLIAGPSVLATLLLMHPEGGAGAGGALGSLLLAWSGAALILLAAPALYRRLGRRGLVAIERLMGMVLVAISVQMLIDGLRAALG